MRCSVGVQSVEARLVLETRRGTSSRGAGSKSPSPRDAGARAFRHVQDEASGVKPIRSSVIKDNSGGRQVRAPALSSSEPSRTTTVGHGIVQLKKGESAHFGLALAADSRGLGPEGQKQQKRRPIVEFGGNFARKCNDKSRPCRPCRALAVGPGPAPFGSEEYLEHRRQRTAQGEEVVRQCAAGLDKMSSLISNEATRRAKKLVRRLASEKQRKAQQKVAGTKKEQQAPAATVKLAKDEPIRERQPCAADGHSPAAQLVRRPWRVGASSSAWAESRPSESRILDEPRRLEKTLEGETIGRRTSDLVEDCARAVVERFVRRACLNLSNRPWRLAGVRLSIDRRYHAARGPRQRVRRTTRKKDDPSAALGELQLAQGNVANNGIEFCGWAWRGGKPHHRRLVRPRTSPEDSRGLGSTRPSPPPFPQRRHASFASWERGAEADRRHEAGNYYDSCRHDLLHGTFEARLEDSGPEGVQGWIPLVEDVKDTATGGLSGFAEEILHGPPSCRRKTGVELPPQSCQTTGYRARGRSSLDQATAKEKWNGERTRNLSRGSSTRRQVSRRPRWDERFWVPARDVPAATTPTCEKRDLPSCRVTFEQDFGPRGPFPVVRKGGLPADDSMTTSSGGYSTGTFDSEDVSASSQTTFSGSLSLGAETSSEACGAYDDAHLVSSPLMHQLGATKEKAMPASMGRTGDEEAWHTEDVVAPREAQPAGLLGDARMFANRLTRLAEGNTRL